MKLSLKSVYHCWDFSIEESRRWSKFMYSIPRSTLSENHRSMRPVPAWIGFASLLVKATKCTDELGICEVTSIFVFKSCVPRSPYKSYGSLRYSIFVRILSFFHKSEIWSELRLSVGFLEV